MAVQPGLYPTWSETLETGFLLTRLNHQLTSSVCEIVNNTNRTALLTENKTCDQGQYQNGSIHHTPGKNIEMVIVIWDQLFQN